MKRVNDKAGTTRARAALAWPPATRTPATPNWRARNTESVIHDFPGTPYAETATKALAELGQ